LYGNVKSKDRIKEYKEVNNEDNKVIIATYGIASTGISINRLFNLVLVNAGKSFTRTIQSIGRGLRIAKDKDFVNIFDYAMNTKYSTRHLSERKTYYKESEYPFEIIKRKI
jgi:type I site-specific restriction endonuclease